jgi:hypothetical protein
MRDASREASCYRWLHIDGSPPPALRAVLAEQVFMDWAGFWRPDNGSDMQFYGLDATWFLDDFTPFGLTQQHRPTPVSGGIPLTSTFKLELCVGILYVSDTMIRRIYRPMINENYVTGTGELGGAGRLSMEQNEEFLLLGWDWINVQPSTGNWELIAFTRVQAELMTHNHRKVHVSLTELGALEG